MGFSAFRGFQPSTAKGYSLVLPAMEKAMAAEKKAERIPDKDPSQDTDWEWLKMPAPYCDTFAVDAWQTGVVRLTFGEYTMKGFLPFFRAAVVMPQEDAKQLAEAILEQIQKAEKEMEKELKAEAVKKP